MGKNLFIQATNKTPSINFKAKSGLLQIHGYSLPENYIEFYEPILEWLDEYTEAPNEKTEFDIRMVLINASSSKIFIDIIRKIKKLVERNNSEVSV